MAVQLLQQKRMAHALGRVQHYAGRFAAAPPAEAKSSRRKFKARASELPFMIHANGLGQALAFFKSKSSKGDKDKYGCLYEILSDWLTQEGRPLAGHTDAITGVTECDRTAYIQAQAEAILLMNWVRMFAASFMDVAETDTGNQENTSRQDGAALDADDQDRAAAIDVNRDGQDGQDGREGEAG